VKPLHLNLASRPYRDERPFILVVVIGSLLIAYLTLTNFDTWYRYRNETQETRAKIAALEKQAADERASTATLNQRLRAVDVKMLAKQTQFANIQLAQRAFSWSELLDHLERTLPDYVRIESISPTFGDNGVVTLSLQCVARDPDRGDGLAVGSEPPPARHVVAHLGRAAAARACTARRSESLTRSADGSHDRRERSTRQTPARTTHCVRG